MAEKGKSSAHTKKPCAILTCNCAANRNGATQYQEQKYGKSQRVHNPTANGYACTGCQNVKSY